MRKQTKRFLAALLSASMLLPSAPALAANTANGYVSESFVREELQETTVSRDRELSLFSKAAAPKIAGYTQVKTATLDPTKYYLIVSVAKNETDVYALYGNDAGLSMGPGNLSKNQADQGKITAKLTNVESAPEAAYLRDNTVLDIADKLHFTVDKMDDGYSFRSADGNFLSLGGKMLSKNKTKINVTNQGDNFTLSTGGRYLYFNVKDEENGFKDYYTDFWGPTSNPGHYGIYLYTKDGVDVTLDLEDLEKIVDQEVKADRKPEDYLAKSWGVYEKALKKAKECADNQNGITQGMVDTVVDELSKAVASLSPIPVYEAPSSEVYEYVLHTTGVVEEGDQFVIFSNNGNAYNDNRVLHSDGAEKTDRVRANLTEDGNKIRLDTTDSISVEEQLWEVVAVSDNEIGLQNVDTDGNRYLDLTRESSDKVFLSDTPKALTISANDASKGLYTVSGSNGLHLNFSGAQFKAQKDASQFRFFKKTATLPTEAEIEGPSGEGLDQPFKPNSGGSANFRIPALITLSDGTLVAAADSRWNHAGDACSIDIRVATSTDNGVSWDFTTPLYFNDSTNAKHTYGACFIDPVMVRDQNDKIYLMADLYPGGIAINTAPKAPHKASGYMEIDGAQRLVLYTTPDADVQTDDNYAYYVGDFDGEYAPVYEVVPEKEADDVSDNSASNNSASNNDTDKKEAAFYMDKGFYLYTKDKKPMYCAQLGSTDKIVKQNVFFYNALLHVRCATYLYLVTSDDNGATWSDPMILNPQIRKTENPDIFYGVGPGAGLCLEDGTIILPCYTYSNQLASFIYSTDDGKTWKRSDTATKNEWSSESCLVQLDEKTIRHFYRDGYDYIRYTDHTLEGDKWVAGTPVSVTNAPKRDNNQLSAIRYSDTIDASPVILVSTASNPNGRQDGKIYAFTVDMTKDDMPMELVSTFDNVPNNTTDNYAYSSLTELINGNIGLLYESAGSQITYKTITLDQFSPEIIFDNDETRFKITGELNKVYDGTAVSTEKIEVRSVREDQVTYKFYEDQACTEELEAAPVNAGTYWVKGFMAEKDDKPAAHSNALSFTIEKASVSVKAAEVAYNESTEKFTIESIELAGFVKEESLASGTDFEAEVVSGELVSDTEANVVIKITLKDTEAAANYKAEKESFTVAAKVTEIIVSEFVIEGELDKEYDGKAVETASIKAEEDDITFKFYEAKEGKLLTEAPKNVGAYYVVAVKTEGDKEIASNQLSFTITPAVLSVSGADVDVTVSESHAEANVEKVYFEGLKNNEVLTINEDYTAQAVLPAAISGNHVSVTVSVSLNDTTAAANYSLSDNNVEVSVSVNDGEGSEKPDTPDTPDLAHEGIWVTGLEDADYTGSKITQQLIVYDGDKRLAEKVDYTLIYKNNTNAYTIAEGENGFNAKKAPSVTIKMKGDYKDSKVLYFKINPVSLSDEDQVITDDITVTNTGKKVKAAPKLYWEGKTLKNNKDYTVTVVGGGTKAEFTAAGTYTLVITGKGNFTGERTIDFTVTESDKVIGMEDVKVKAIKAQTWSDQAPVTPVPEVSYKKASLTAGKDYTVSYINNRAGLGFVVLTGTGESQNGLTFTGVKYVPFKLNGMAMSKVKVEGLNAQGYDYTGDEIRPLEMDSVSVVFSDKKLGNIKLEKDVHYTVVYERNVAKGTATMILTGIEEAGFVGTKKQTFKVAPAALNETDFHISLPEEEAFMKGSTTTEVLVESADGTILVDTKDYKLSYKNNKKVGSTAEVTISGKGNYGGKVTKTFKVVQKDIDVYQDEVRLAVNDKVISSKKFGWRQNVKIVDANGKALAANKDYDKNSVQYFVEELGNNGSGANVSVSDNLTTNAAATLPVDSVIRVEVKLKGDYAGTLTGTYRILAEGRDISKAAIQLNPQEFTGEEVIIDSADDFKKSTLRFKKDTYTLVLDGEETEGNIRVVEGSYQKNIFKGTAKVTFEGIGEFGGQKTVSFKIGPRSIVNNFGGLF